MSCVDLIARGGGCRLQGLRTILAGPEHQPYGVLCAALGRQLGRNDLKAIEITGFFNANAGLEPEPSGYRAGARAVARRFCSPFFTFAGLA